MQIKANNPPWAGKFASLKSVATASINKTAPLDSNGQKLDARKALANALVWYYTDDTAYAEKAINILNVWAKSPTITFDPVKDNPQRLLQAGWIGSLMGPAAEIMRGYTGWMQEDIAATQVMFKTFFYPDLNKASTWNGNVDLTQIDAMLAIAVFNEDKTLFDAAITRFNGRLPYYIYLKADGDTPKTRYGAGWFSPVKLVEGLTQETCRNDTNYNGAKSDGGHHAQYALAAVVNAAEVAWNQGVDLYGDNQNRIVSALELLSLQLTSGTLQGTCTIDVATKETYNTFEMGYNHYHHRKMLDLPNTKSMLETKVRVNSQSDWNIFFESLTHQKEF